MECIILRFLGKMPRGRFEYTCTCGNYEITTINSNDKRFVCKICEMKIHIWEQENHWHLSLIKEGDGNYG